MCCGIPLWTPQLNCSGRVPSSFLCTLAKHGKLKSPWFRLRTTGQQPTHYSHNKKFYLKIKKSHMLCSFSFWVPMSPCSSLLALLAQIFKSLLYLSRKIQMKFWRFYSKLFQQISERWLTNYINLHFVPHYIGSQWSCSPRRLTVFQFIAILLLKLHISGSTARLSFTVSSSLLWSTAS